MRMRRLLATATILAAVFSTTWAGAVDPLVREEPYIAGPVGDAEGLCAEDPLNPTGQNIGVVCITPARTRVSIAIIDATTLPIGGNYVFTDSSGAAIGGAIAFCGSISSKAVPSGAAKLVVYIAGPTWGPLACIVDNEDGYPGIGTNGTVRATFT